VDQKSGDIQKYLSNDELSKILSANNKMSSESTHTSDAMPESTFNLKLKKDEQEAKDNLILPYMR